jgi:hypothetical protein
MKIIKIKSEEKTGQAYHQIIQLRWERERIKPPMDPLLQWF